MYKNNSRDCSKLKSCNPLQLHRKLKVWHSEIGYYSYTKRCSQLKKTNKDDDSKGFYKIFST